MSAANPYASAERDPFAEAFVLGSERTVRELGQVAIEAIGHTNFNCPTCDGELLRLFRPGSSNERQQIFNPEDAADVLVPMLSGLDREHCVLLSLDTRHRLLTVSTVSIGSANHTFMSPREVFRDALRVGASAVMLGHNHPSGDPEPSRDDELVTQRLENAGDMLGIHVLDHIVVGDEGRWESLARRRDS